MTCQPPLSSKLSQTTILKTLAHAGVAGMVFAVLALATPVQAQSTPSILNAAHWTLSPITSNDTKDRHFCAVKGNFGTAVSLVFARDSAGGQSLALEYPDKSFAAGATLPTMLALGPTQYQSTHWQRQPVWP